MGDMDEDAATGPHMTTEVTPRSGIDSLEVYGRGSNISADPPGGQSRSASRDPLFVRKTRGTCYGRLKRYIQTKKPLYYFFIVVFLSLHWIDYGTDVYMIQFYKDKGYKTFHIVAALFFVLSTFLSFFWNYQLFKVPSEAGTSRIFSRCRNLTFAILATILGPVARNVFVEVMPRSQEHPESWRLSDEVYTEEVKNFTMIFAALFEDLPQASVNLAFLSRTDRTIPKEAVIQVVASIVMGVFKIQLGCHNILCNYDKWERHYSGRFGHINPPLTQQEVDAFKQSQVSSEA